MIVGGGTSQSRHQPEYLEVKAHFKMQLLCEEGKVKLVFISRADRFRESQSCLKAINSEKRENSMENFYTTKSRKALWAPLLRNDPLSCISFQLLVISWSLFHLFLM